METIQHGLWKFDNVPNKSVYSINSDTVVNRHFTKYDGYDDNKYFIMNDYRKVAIIHRLIRNSLEQKMCTGVLYSDLVNEAEKILKKFIKPEQCGGFAFPLGISVNEIIAHDSAMIDDKRTLKKNDVVKLDLGVHINGLIIDSAFTKIIDGDKNFIDLYDPLLQATMDATYTGISLSGVDAQLYEISEGISEVISSYELDDGTEIKPVIGLGGHNIMPYKVHGGKLILSVPHDSQKGSKMEDGEVYAIETYASTGNGFFKQKSLDHCNHFSLHENIKDTKRTKQNAIIQWELNENHNLPFTQRWCEHIADGNKLNKLLNEGISDRTIIPFPPLADKAGSKTSQFEHTIHIKENAVEILSLGSDY